MPDPNFQSSPVEENLALYQDKAAIADNAEDESLISTIKRWLSESKKFQATYSKHWPMYYKFFIGKQWPSERPSWKYSECINDIWATVWSTVAIMTDNRPDVEFAPQEPTDTDWTEALSQIEKRNWTKLGWDNVTTQVVTEANIYDAAFSISEWDPDLEEGIGDIAYRRLDPYYCYPDPMCLDINDPNSRYFIVACPESTKALRNKYPHLAKDIYSDVTPMKNRDRSTSNSIRVYTDVDKGGLDYDGPKSDASGKDSEGLTMRLRCWMRSDATVQEKVEKADDSGKITQIYQLKKKYPKGRYVEIICNKIVVDGDNGAVLGFDKTGQAIIEPYEDGMFPITKLVDHDLPGEFYGQGEVPQLIGPQKTTNFLWAALVDHVRMVGNPQTILATNTGVESSKITNRPGLVIETNNMNGIRRESGEALPAGLLQLFDVSLRNTSRVSGIQDVTQGAVQPGITSGLMLEGYVEAAQTRIRLKVRNLDHYLQQVGQLHLSRIMQFYKQPRIYRITNAQNLPEFLEFYITEDKDGKKFVNIKNLSTGEQKSVATKGFADVKINTGSSLPFAKAQKIAAAKELYNAQAIDRESLLTEIQWPKAMEIIQRMGQQEQAMAQQAAQGGA